MLVQLQGREVWYLQLNEAVSRRLVELMQERGMTQYQLYMKSGVPKSTIGNVIILSGIGDRPEQLFCLAAV